MFTSAHHLSLSWARSNQFIPPTSHFLCIHLNIILPSMPGSSKLLFPSDYPTKSMHAPFLSPILAIAPPISFFSIWSPE
jgi:hypothetical protein